MEMIYDENALLENGSSRSFDGGALVFLMEELSSESELVSLRGGALTVNASCQYWE